MISAAQLSVLLEFYGDYSIGAVDDTDRTSEFEELVDLGLLEQESPGWFRATPTGNAVCLAALAAANKVPVNRKQEGSEG